MHLPLFLKKKRGKILSEMVVKSSDTAFKWRKVLLKEHYMTSSHYTTKLLCQLMVMGFIHWSKVNYTAFDKIY